MNTDNDTSTAQAKKSSMKPTTAEWPMPGMAKFFWNRSPYASMIVRMRMVKPQNVNAWARPGTVHLRSRRWPTTSVASTSAFLPQRLSRSGAGLPEWTRRNR